VCAILTGAGEKALRAFGLSSVSVATPPARSK
jgi:hypothetical protein